MKSLAVLNSILALLIISAGTLIAQPGSFSDDFASASPNWHTFSGSWKVDNGEYTQSASDFDLGTALDRSVPSKFRLSVKVKATGDFVGGGLSFNMTSLDSKNNMQMVRFDTEGIVYGYFDRKGEFQYQGTIKVPVKPSKWYELTVVVNNETGKYAIFYNGKPVKEGLSLEYVNGYVGLQSAGGPQSFDQFSLTTPSTTELAAAKSDCPFTTPKGIAVDRDGAIYISQRTGSVIAVVNTDGKRVRSFGKHGSGKYELTDPGALAFDAQGRNLYALDVNGKKVVKFASTGKPIREISLSDLETPVDIAVDKRGNVFVVDYDKCCVAAYDPAGKLRATFGTKGTGNDQFDGPKCITIDKTDRIFVGDQDWYKCRTQILSFDPKSYKIAYKETNPYTWGTTDLVVTSKNRLASYGALDLWNNAGVIRLFETNLKPCGNFSGFSVGVVGRHGAIAVGPKDEMYMLDSDQSRIYIIPSTLSEPRPNVDAKAWKTTITWDSNTDDPARFRYRKEKSKTAIWTEMPVKSQGRKHTVVVPDLDDVLFYDYEISPTVKTIPATDWSKEYRFLTFSGYGQTTMLNIDLVVAIYLSSDIDGKTQCDIPMDKLGTKIQTEFDKAKMFWLRNSLYKVNINFKDYVIITDKRVKVNGGWVDPEEVKNDLRPRLAAQKKDLKNYDSVIALFAQPNYDASKPDWLGWTNGAGLTPFGYSVMGMGGTQDWLFVHEFDHQMDAFFDKSGFPEYWFDHPDTTVHPGYFGSQFDVNAHIWRTLPRSDWFWDRYASVITCVDKDEDGVPDNDPRLAMDEKRLGSDPTKKDTDGDGLDDLHEADAGIFTSSDPNNPDTDGDGIPDGQDPYPLYPIKLNIPEKTVTIDGKIGDGEWTPLMAAKGPYIGGETYLNWEKGYVEFACIMDKPFNLIFDVDADADGWFNWTGFYEVRVTANKPDQPCVAKGTDGIEAKSSVVNGKTVLEVRVPVTSKRYELIKGQPMSFRIGFETPDGVQHLFDPWEMPRLIRN